jgi:hypothetical protein
VYVVLLHSTTFQKLLLDVIIMPPNRRKLSLEKALSPVYQLLLRGGEIAALIKILASSDFRKKGSRLLWVTMSLLTGIMMIKLEHI